MRTIEPELGAHRMGCCFWSHLTRSAQSGVRRVPAGVRGRENEILRRHRRLCIEDIIYCSSLWIILGGRGGSSFCMILACPQGTSNGKCRRSL